MCVIRPELPPYQPYHAHIAQNKKTLDSDPLLGSSGEEVAQEIQDPGHAESTKEVDKSAAYLSYLQNCEWCWTAKFRGNMYCVHQTTSQHWKQALRKKASI